MKKQNKYLVRPHDSHVFEVDLTNGCYHSLSTRDSANRPKAYDHFTYENLTQNHNFFEIEESEIERYDKKNDLYHEWIGWVTRSDGHGGSKGGTFEEYVKKHNLHICDICGDAFSGKSFDVVNENFEDEGLTQCERCYSENLLGGEKEISSINQKETRYELLCREIKFQIEYIDDYYVMDFAHLQTMLDEIKLLQIELKKTIKCK